MPIIHPMPPRDAAAIAAMRADGRGDACLLDLHGGGLTLALLSVLATGDADTSQPVGATVMSPWTDLALADASMMSRAGADTIVTRSVLASFAASHLQGHPAADFRASPRHAPMRDVPARTALRRVVLLEPKES